MKPALVIWRVFYDKHETIPGSLVYDTEIAKDGIMSTSIKRILLFHPTVLSALPLIVLGLNRVCPIRKELSKTEIFQTFQMPHSCNMSVKCLCFNNSSLIIKA